MPAIQFGLALPFGTSRMAADLAQLAEQHGWDGCFLGDAIWCEDPLIALTAAAMTTTRIRLGTMVLAMPLRRPWHLASQSLAIDRLSQGRLILGLGSGAVWMGWQGFPDFPTDKKTRAEMLDESIDILTLLYQCKPFDFDGKHYHLMITRLDEKHYPPRPVQQPRIPLWVTGVIGYPKSMQRLLKCDGVFPEKIDAQGQHQDIQPEDIRQLRDYVQARRTLETPFEIVVEGKLGGMTPGQQQDKLLPLVEAGITWWVEGLWSEDQEQVEAHIRRGPAQR